jgi:hypothetical protein
LKRSAVVPGGELMMTYDEDNIPFDVSEETERLIVRHLDGEIGVAEQARLDQILADSEDARLMLAEYRRMDAMAAGAMRTDLASAYACAAARVSDDGSRLVRRRLTRQRVGVAGALVAAAAVALAVMLNTGPRGPEVAVKSDSTIQVQPNSTEPNQFTDQVASGSPVPRIQKLPRDSAPYGTAMPVDLAEYREMDHQPRHRFGNVYRDLIGIRGSNPNRIYILEREAQKTNAVLISGDF